MSLYQFAAAVDGWNAANEVDGAVKAPDSQEFEAAKRAHGDD